MDYYFIQHSFCIYYERGRNVNTRKTGSEYEEKAATFLKEQGIFILETNFRCRFGEIDLIARDKNTLVFLEVKYRKNGSCGSPLEAVDWRKQRTICKVSDYYRVRHQITDSTPMRYDVIGIGGEDITWVKNAFDYIG